MGSGAAIAIKDLAGSAAFKEKISNFSENSKALIGLLEEVGKVHPFIQSISFTLVYVSNADLYSVVAVFAFNAAITLELNRRENDQKVVTLNVAMCDMMQVIVLSVKYSLL